MDNNEQEAILSLVQYFNDEFWIVIDVGTNKGTWSDILINYRDSSVMANKYEVHMFECNQMLLNYLKVKFDYNEHIIYCDRACYSESHQVKLFDCFEDYHSGLSSLYHNPKWEQIEKKQKQVKTITLDDYAESVHSMYRTSNLSNEPIKEIDIIKIDVEGAEMDVLLGCEYLLREHKIKFIQVEYSEHYKVSQHTFKQLLDYISALGYNAWTFDGTYFNKVNKETFVEDYQAHNFILTYKEIGRYHYTQLWNSEFIKNTQHLKGKINLALEIGCFEGLTSNYICDQLLVKGEDPPNPTLGRLICVDPLEDRYLLHADKATNDMFIGQYDRFIHNTKDQGIELLRKQSSQCWEYLSQYLFDFIYIDGDHTEQVVYADGVNALRVLRPGGSILFDDYQWSEGTKKGINRFLHDKVKEIDVQLIDYQALVTKR